MSRGVDSDAWRTIRGTLANYFAALFQMGLFVFHILAARFFGNVAYGAYVFAWSMVEMGCKVGIMGMDKGMLRGVAVARARGDEGAAVLAVATGLKVAASASLMVIGVLWLIAFVQEVATYRSALFALAPLVLPWSIVLVLVCATMATSTMRYNLLVRGLGEPAAMVTMVTFFGLFFAAWGEVGLASAHLAASVITVILATLAFRKRINAGRMVRDLVSRALDRPLLGFTVPIMPAELLNQAIYRLDIIFLGLYLKDPTVVASYGAAVLLASVISSVRYAFDPILSPLVAECTTRGEVKRLGDNLARMTRWVAALSLPIFATLVVFGDLFLGLWGPQYADARSALAVLCLAHLVNSVLGLHQWPVVMSGRSRLDLLNNVIGFVVIVALNVALIPTLGVTGAALATLAGNLAFRGLQVVQVRWLFGVSSFSRHVVRLALAWAMGGGIQVAVRALSSEAGWGTCALAVISGSTVSIIAALVMGLAPEDREFLGALFGRWHSGGGRGRGEGSITP